MVNYLSMMMKYNMSFTREMVTVLRFFLEDKSPKLGANVNSGKGESEAIF